ncbi:MAG: hypothetical protein ABI977_29420, partial [Acidobacteriota bacterium]
MLNLDTHILIYLLEGTLHPREHQLVLQQPLAISDIVLWELAKLQEFPASYDNKPLPLAVRL